MLVSRPMGLLALLDEESRFPRATDRSLVGKFNYSASLAVTRQSKLTYNVWFIEKFHCNIKCSYYVRPKSNALQFEVKHFAGNVTYQASGMLEKNRHLLAIEAIQVLRKSSNKTVRALFQSPVTKTGNLYSQVRPIVLNIFFTFQYLLVKTVLNIMYFFTSGLVYRLGWTRFTISRSADCSNIL